MKSSFSEWEESLAPLLETMGAALHECDLLIEQCWVPAIVATSDQLQATARDIHTWVRTHPCPHRDFDFALERIARSLEYSSLTLEAMVKGSWVEWSTIDRERRSLYVAVTQLQMMMFEQAQRDS